MEKYFKLTVLRILLLLVFIVTFGCTKRDEPIAETVTGTFNATLKATINHAQPIDSSVAEIFVTNATVTLYLTKQNALNETNAEESLVTNIHGQADFYNLSHPEYYVVIYHAWYGTHLDSVSTPANSIFYWNKQI